MKQTILAIGILIFIGCGNKKNETTLPKEERQSIAAMYVFGGKIEVGFLYRVIQVTTKEDSVTKKVNLVVDTIWGVPRVFNRMDSTGKPMLDSLKRPIVDERAIFISKDSLTTEIQNKDLSTLAKERFPNVKN